MSNKLSETSFKTSDSMVDTAIMIDKKSRVRALMGSAVGSIIEWYDFFLYGTMSGLIFGPLFFPAESATASQLLAFTSFALAFLIRPIGGIFFSHFGDRIGRKNTLVVTLTMMGLSTTLIGLMPTYNAIGVAAPILLTLLRLLQGFSLGGEWGGGILMAVEYSPRERRGLYAAVPQTGAMFGLALGNFTVSILSLIFTEEQFLSFGWRIPFLLSVILLIVGLWIRSKVAETPSFKKVKEEGTTARIPLVETLKKHWRSVLVVIGAKFIETSTFFLFATFTISYGISLGFSRTQVLNGVLIAAIVAIPVMFVVGSLSDRFGRKRMYILGTILIMAYIVPFFWMMNQGSVFLLTTALIIGFGVIWPIYGAVLPSLFAESFSAEVRYTGVSLGYQVGAALVGGPAPLIATALLSAYGGSYLPIALFIIANGMISLIALSFAKERHHQELDA
ncbi:MAG: L-Proline/Glycine betaine transporter ProP [Candidatus Carbobacillus altaicus]|uniref:Putative proline/betaine transporter n=1 Tax=Candidatus Carbonibacillus altaicus TaxID=2163959 RepID=A0A2R6XZP6_9BACL|nr:MAG: L-Proline/Glycine betaine transporter ProP [Candidatus Carbobacillus altaicus]